MCLTGCKEKNNSGIFPHDLMTKLFPGKYCTELSNKILPVNCYLISLSSGGGGGWGGLEKDKWMLTQITEVAPVPLGFWLLGNPRSGFTPIRMWFMCIAHRGGGGGGWGVGGGYSGCPLLSAHFFCHHSCQISTNKHHKVQANQSALIFS